MSGQPPSTAAAVLQERLGLSDDELLATLAADPLTVVAGDLEHRPEVAILLALTQEAAEQVGPDVLRRWLRVRGPGGRPVNLLLARDFVAFEVMLDELRERGLVVRGGG